MIHSSSVLERCGLGAAGDRGRRAGGVAPLAAPAPGARRDPQAWARASARGPAFRELYDNLLATLGDVPRRLVVAAPGAVPRVDWIVDGLACHAVARGRGVLTAVLGLQGERPVLRGRVPDAGELEAELPATNLPRPIDDWLHLRPDIDLVIVAGPPLVDTMQAALLARHCDGLLLVASPFVTRRIDLHRAVERARRTHCRLLGAVWQEPSPAPPRPVGRLARVLGGGRAWLDWRS